MTYWIRWQSATATAYDGPRIGPFNHRRDAVRHMGSILSIEITEVFDAVGVPIGREAEDPMID